MLDFRGMNSYIYLKLQLIWINIKLKYINLSIYISNPKRAIIMLKMYFQRFFLEQKMKKVDKKIIRILKEENVWDDELKIAWNDVKKEEKEREKVLKERVIEGSYIYNMPREELREMLKIKYRRKKDYFRKLSEQKLLELESSNE